MQPPAAEAEPRSQPHSRPAPYLGGASLPAGRGAGGGGVPRRGRLLRGVRGLRHLVASAGGAWPGASRGAELRAAAPAVGMSQGEAGLEHTAGMWVRGTARQKNTGKEVGITRGNVETGHNSRMLRQHLEPCPRQVCHPPGGVTPGPSAVTTGVGTDGGGGASAKSWWGRSAWERGF